MSSQTHQIILTAKDGTKQTFTAIERGAKADAKALQEMGRAGSAGLKQVDDAAKNTAKSHADLEKRMAALGAVVATGAGLLADWSRSAQDAEAIQRQLEASIAATGETYAQYADQIEEVGKRAVQLGQDDEAASQAISALTQITGSATVAINEMGLVFDLAAAKGMTLENAAELVGKVHEGNTAILQRYGIVVEKNATAEEALAQIQAQVAGQAEAHATTYARLREELSNVTDAIGGAVDGFAPMLSLLPGLSSGFTLAGSAIGALAPNLTKAGAATSLLNLAMGPVGLVAAAGAAVIAAKELSDWLDHGYTDAVKGATEASESFIDVLNGLFSSGSPLAGMAAEWRADLVSIGGSTQDLDAFIKSLEDGIRDLAEEQANLGTDNSALIVEMQKSLDALRALRDQFGSGADAAREYGETLDALAAIATHTGPGQEEILRQAEALHDELVSRGIPFLAEYEERIQTLAGQMGELDRAATEANEKIKTSLDLMIYNGKEWVNVLEAVREETEKNAFSLGNYAEQASAGADAITDTTKAYYDQIYATQQLTAANDQNAFSLNNVFRASVENGKAMTEEAEAKKEAADATMLWRVENQEGADTLGTLAARASAGDDALGGLTGSLEKSETAMERMARGSTSAGVALRAFKDIQDGIISSQDQFTGQLSEYNQQLGYIENAEKLLNERKAAGIELTQEQIDFLDGADAAQERLQGGVEDATIALGMQAEQYGENMSEGDRLNQTMGGLDNTMAGLQGTITALTLALITLDGTDANANVHVGLSGLSQSDILGLRDALLALDGTYANAGAIIGGGGYAGGMLGGMFAGGGLVPAAPGRLVRVNEGGIESATLPTGDNVWLPSGSTVWPHAASVMGAKKGGNGAPMFTNCSFVIQANNPQEFYRQLQSARIGSARR